MNPAITKNEKVRLIGTRATQLSEGAKPTVDIKDMIDPLKIAEKEYDMGTIPLSIIRTMPGGIKVRIDISSRIK